MPALSRLILLSFFTAGCGSAGEPELPVQPTDVRLRYTTSSCFGTCARIAVTLERSGDGPVVASYFGQQCVERHGFFMLDVDDATLDAVYDEARLALETFVDPGECEMVDGQSFGFTVVADGIERVARSADCHDPDEVAVFGQELRRAIPALMDLRGSPPLSCFGAAFDSPVGDSVVIESTDGDLGVLSLDERDRSWRLATCAGELVSEGELRLESFTPSDVARLLGGPQLYEWVGAGPTHAVEIAIVDDVPTATVDATAGFVTQTLRAGTACAM